MTAARSEDLSRADKERLGGAAPIRRDRREIEILAHLGMPPDYHHQCWLVRAHRGRVRQVRNNGENAGPHPLPAQGTVAGAVALGTW